MLDWALPIAVTISTALTIFILTLPNRYGNQDTHPIQDSNFTDQDKQNASRSGYAVYQARSNGQKTVQPATTVQVVVLGDIGRSPRMQYHALSLARHGARVSLIGYADSEVHPDIQANRLITIVPLPGFPKALQTSSKLLFLITAPLKVLHQISSLYFALAYATPEPSKWMLVQNPPSIPVLMVCTWICFFRNTRLVIDWHNFGYSILALRLGPKHPLVRVSEWYEGFFGKMASAHFAVTNAMCKVLRTKWAVEAVALHDRPPLHFQPFDGEQREAFLHRLPDTADFATQILEGDARLLVSSTSWTPDEDFSLLLDALVTYANSTSSNKSLPRILAIITGKGPQKEHYLRLIAKLTDAGKLPSVLVRTAWLSTEDYASLLASADLGISLHTSSSGVDLPMKVVDMFGAGLPVAGWSKFEAWPELVTEGVNGRGFGSAEELTRVLEEVLPKESKALGRLRKAVLEEGEKRWEDEWMPVAGKLFGLGD